MTTYFGKSCSFCLPRVPFVNCRLFMYLVISLLVLRAGYGIWLYQFLIIAYLFTLLNMSHDKTNPTKWRCVQWKLGSDWASAQSSLSSQWVARNPSFLHADSEDSDQTGRMPRLIWVFAWRTLVFFVLSCRGSYTLSLMLISWKPHRFAIKGGALSRTLALFVLEHCSSRKLV